MAYDEILASRIRKLAGDEPDLSEKKLFGGLAFLVNGNMAVSASSHGGIIVRVDPTMTDAIITSSDASIMEMRARPLPGWLRVDPEYLSGDDRLAKWVQMGVAYAKILPTKQK